VSLALAIALHNIPEGVAVALPVYFATRSRWQGFLTAFLSGLAEPLAVVVVGLLLPVDIPKHWVNCMLAAVGGIMAFLSFHELLPLSIQHAGRTAGVTSLFVGMAIMSFNLWVLDTYVTAGMPH
jgi:ZIP family zinc transporter